MKTKFLYWVKDRPVLSYCILTFLISWGSVAILGLVYGMPMTSATFDKSGAILMIPYLLGPFLASLALTGIIEGRRGYRALLARFHPGVGLQWYALSILFIPILILIVLGLLSRFNAGYIPSLFSEVSKTETILTGLAIGFFGGGLFEEIGWTGFLLPRLRLKFKSTTSGILIGFIWAFWHLLPTYWGSGDQYGNLSLGLFIPPVVFYAAVLPAYRVLMVWLYERTKSLFVTMLAHMTLTASTIFILPPGVVGNPLSLYYLLFATILWLLIAFLKNNVEHHLMTNKQEM